MLFPKGTGIPEDVFALCLLLVYSQADPCLPLPFDLHVGLASSQITGGISPGKTGTPEHEVPSS